MKPNLKKQQKIESKERILNVASRLFKKNGFTATGIDQIMEEAGLTAGGFYAHFKSKTDLLEQAIKHSMKHSRKLLIQNTEHLSGQEKVNEIMRRYVSTMHRDWVEKGCVLPALAAEIYRGTNQSNKIISQYLNEWAEFIAEQLPVEENSIKRKEKALALISQAVGSILLSRMVKQTELSNEIINSFQKIF